MTQFVQTLEGAVVVAAIYLLVGLGWNLVYATCGYLNLAVGEFYVLAGVLAAKLPDVLGTSSTLVLAPAVVIIVGVLAWASERVLIRPLDDRGLPVILVTLGLALVLGEVIRRMAPEIAVRSAEVFSGPPFDVAGVRFARQDVVIVVTAACAVGAVAAFLLRTDLGRTFRACADDRAAARALGVDLPRIETAAFVAGAVVVAIAGFVATPALGVAAGSAELLAVKSFLAVSIGGIGSHRGAVLGALVVAATEAMVARYWSSDVEELVVLALLVVLLVALPGRARRGSTS